MEFILIKYSTGFPGNEKISRDSHRKIKSDMLGIVQRFHRKLWIARFGLKYNLLIK